MPDLVNGYFWTREDRLAILPAVELERDRDGGFGLAGTISRGIDLGDLGPGKTLPVALYGRGWDGEVVTLSVWDLDPARRTVRAVGGGP